MVICKTFNLENLLVLKIKGVRRLLGVRRKGREGAGSGFFRRVSRGTGRRFWRPVLRVTTFFAY